MIQDHFKGDEILDYPLRSVKTGADTLFKVKAYHPCVKAIESVDPPLAYLIPKSDSTLVAWLRRSHIGCSDTVPADSGIFGFRLTGEEKTNFEGIPGVLPLISKLSMEDLKPEDYLMVPVRGIFSLKLILALEPRAMYGLATYPDFRYLVSREVYPILRVEKQTGK
ncbi:MAG: hypothetical protein M9926_03135 [Lentimicrobium sp.]|nr:hypothetical protein [Lentimicrobium sp.]